MVSHKAAGNALRVLLPLAVIYSCGAVATRTKFHEPIAEELRSGNYDAAADRIRAAREKNKYGEKDRLLYYLDSGMINHYAGYFDTSNVELSSAEDAADELFTKSISRAAASLALNDNILEYAGEDHEILYTNLIKALNYISVDEFDEAFVEIRRANEKLELLEQKYALAAEEFNTGGSDEEENVSIDYEAARVRFNNDAFARYLSMRIYAAEGKMDDARIDLDWLLSAFDTQPHIYDFDPPHVEIASEDKALLSVVGLAGLAPVKEALNLRIRTDKDLDLVQVFYTDSERKDVEYGHLPIPVSADYYFKFAIPKLVPRPSMVSKIEISIDGKPIGQLELIEDISSVAGETFKAKSSLIYLRTVARAVAKGLAAHKLKVKADTGGLEGWLKKAAVDVATDISENADLRCARYLPGRIFVGDFEIEPGTYDITVRVFDRDGTEIENISIPQYHISTHGLNLVEAVCLK
jgi:hypothetical protein